MKRKKLYLSAVFFGLFFGFTTLLMFVDKQAIGPNNSVVGLAKLNGWFSNLVGCNMVLYNITDWASILAVAIAIMYAVIGLCQWISRKSIKKVDSAILLLGGFYLFVFGIYMFFNYVVINYRPVLINGYLEPSFPSSTTLMAITFMLFSNYQITRLIKNKKLCTWLKILSIIFMMFLVVGRIISGVHWITDIVASILLSIAIVYLYYYLCDVFDNKNKGEGVFSKNTVNN